MKFGANISDSDLLGLGSDFQSVNSLDEYHARRLVYLKNLDPNPNRYSREQCIEMIHNENRRILQQMSNPPAPSGPPAQPPETQTYVYDPSNPYRPEPQQPYNPYPGQPQQPYNPYPGQPQQPYNPYPGQPQAPYNPYPPQPYQPQGPSTRREEYLDRKEMQRRERQLEREERQLERERRNVERQKERMYRENERIHRQQDRMHQQQVRANIRMAMRGGRIMQRVEREIVNGITGRGHHHHNDGRLGPGGPHHPHHHPHHHRN
ncbi:hypothetical protein HOP50_06g44270 [Chloropicon primus]|uniref:Uncharacterized protein n=1 Tax=Chloropicon primus TaxID=1764295 RepID=A0A5B8MQJ3_9CHLO|nr:hypothetical protein A3770_06p44030 [Chloropicon primus]UPR01106.1 hypothetical protein HOP50_06g44270 [Chloropicon primus]|eukprot:QDZ21885.1 hypothetical protein A3770_06p44030 [Chloropicon primus]